MLATNILRMAQLQSRPGRKEQTRERLIAAALDLFERQGFEATSVAEIASAAGVTEMTFFRHFAAKHRIVFDDPYDAVIASSVAAQPRTADPLGRVVGGIRAAWAQLPEPASDEVRRRVRIVAETPSLRGEVWRNNEVTEGLMVDQLVADGVATLPARAAASAVLAAIAAALFEWALGDDTSLSEAIVLALDTVERRDG